MDTSNWRVFATVAEHGSLTAAAGALNLSQSGVSYAIKSLEERIGLPLFVRHRRGVVLTEPGEELLPLAHDLLNQQERLEQGIARLKGLARGTVRIGSYSSAATTWMPDVLARFKHRYPRISIELCEGAAEEIESDLARNAVDFAITSYRERSGFDWIDLERDRLLAVSKAGNDEAGDAGPLPLASIETVPFIAATSYYERDVNDILAALGIQPRNVVCRSRNNRTIMAMAKEGLGTALLFERIVQASGMDGIAVRDVEPAISRRIGIAVRSLDGASPAAQALIRAICASHRSQAKPSEPARTCPL